MLEEALALKLDKRIDTSFSFKWVLDNEYMNIYIKKNTSLKGKWKVDDQCLEKFCHLIMYHRVWVVHAPQVHVHSVGKCFMSLSVSSTCRDFSLDCLLGLVQRVVCFVSLIREATFCIALSVSVLICFDQWTLGVICWINSCWKHLCLAGSVIFIKPL